MTDSEYSLTNMHLSIFTTALTTVYCAMTTPDYGDNIKTTCRGKTNASAALLINLTTSWRCNSFCYIYLELATQTSRPLEPPPGAPRHSFEELDYQNTTVWLWKAATRILRSAHIWKHEIRRHKSGRQLPGYLRARTRGSMRQEKSLILETFPTISITEACYGITMTDYGNQQ